MTSKPFAGRIAEILLVEDNPADVELTRQGFSAGKIANNLHVVSA
ncbi:MAG: response regulator, partial [Planctomycetia bacterium]|nr:response regulator [Planctomycetia bacterium]